MLNKKKLKVIANSLGIKVAFNSNKPGFISKNNKRFYSFSDLNKIINKRLEWRIWIMKFHMKQYMVIV